MAGTRLLVAISFALPFVSLTGLSLYYGIPSDDILWKRLQSLLFPPVHHAYQKDTGFFKHAGDQMGNAKPMLLVPTSWNVNELEKSLYEVMSLSESEMESSCENKSYQQPYGRTILLCRGSDHVLAIQNSIYLYSKSRKGLRKMLLSDKVFQPLVGIRVRVVLDQGNFHADWKEAVESLVFWVSSFSNPCIEHISLEIDVIDPNIVQVSPSEMLKSFNTSKGGKIVILYLTSHAHTEAIQNKLGAIEFVLDGGYVYCVDDRSSLDVAFQDGLRRLILNDCWNVPSNIDFSDSDDRGLQTLNQVYNTTIASHIMTQAYKKAQILQYRIDHLHSTARMSSSVDVVEKAVQLIFHGQLKEARDLIHRIQFGMIPDFPLDQYAAIFAPLLFPLLIPVIMTSIREVKRYRKLKA